MTVRNIPLVFFGFAVAAVYMSLVVGLQFEFLISIVCLVLASLVATRTRQKS